MISFKGAQFAGWWIRERGRLFTTLNTQPRLGRLHIH